jgi:hypothetical protein
MDTASINNGSNNNNSVFPSQANFNDQSHGPLLNGAYNHTDEDGNTYDGKWKNNKRHGKGTLKFSNGDKYEG